MMSKAGFTCAVAAVVQGPAALSAFLRSSCISRDALMGSSRPERTICKLDGMHGISIIVVFAAVLAFAAHLCSARAILQQGNEFPGGIILGANATCESSNDEGTLRYTNTLVQICVGNGQWMNVSDVAGALSSLSQRVETLEGILLGGPANQSLGNDVHLFRIDEFTRTSAIVSQREACNYYGSFNVDTKRCECDCSAETGCWSWRTRCSTCAEGFMGETCDEDISECSLNTHTCDTEISVCAETFGSYECICNSGYRQDPNDATVCVDIDECAESTHDCQGLSSCQNEIGSFACTCPEGFALLLDRSNCTESLCGGSANDAALSCNMILEECRDGGSLSSGMYYLNIDGDIVHTYCDMESIGGGWTTCFSITSVETRGNAVQNIPDDGDWRSDIFTTANGVPYTSTVPTNLSVGWVDDSQGGAVGCDRLASSFPGAQFEMMAVVPYRSGSGSGSIAGLRGVVATLPDNWLAASSMSLPGRYFMKSGSSAVQWTRKLGGTDYICDNHFAPGSGMLYSFSSASCGQLSGPYNGVQWLLHLLGTNIEDGGSSCTLSNSFNTCGSGIVNTQTVWNGEGDEFCTSNCHGAGYHTGNVGVGMDILIREARQVGCGEIESTAAPSCLHIRDECSHTGSGLYWVWTPSGPAHTWCEMDLEDGGWTTCFSVETPETGNTAVNNIPDGGDMRTDVFGTSLGVPYTAGLPTTLTPAYMDSGANGGSIGCAFNPHAQEILMVAHYVSGGEVSRYKGVRAPLPSSWVTDTELAIAATRYVKSSSVSAWQNSASNDYVCYSRTGQLYSLTSVACQGRGGSSSNGMQWGLFMMGSNIEDGSGSCSSSDMYNTCAVGIIDRQTSWGNEGDELCTAWCHGPGWGAASTHQPVGMTVYVR